MFKINILYISCYQSLVNSFCQFLKCVELGGKEKFQLIPVKVPLNSDKEKKIKKHLTNCLDTIYIKHNKN